MINQILIDYVRENKNKGYSVDYLKQFLINAGYPADQVEEAVIECEKPNIESASLQQNPPNATASQSLAPPDRHDNYFLRLTGILFKPLKVLDELAPEKGFSAPFKFLIISSLISSFIFFLFNFLTGGSSYAGITGILVLFLEAVVSAIVSIFFTLFVSATFYCISRILRCKAQFYQFFKAYAYMSAFSILLSVVLVFSKFMPVLIILYFIIGIWVLMLWESSLKAYTGIKTGKIVVIIFLFVIFVLILFLSLSFYLSHFLNASYVLGLGTTKLGSMPVDNDRIGSQLRIPEEPSIPESTFSEKEDSSSVDYRQYYLDHLKTCYDIYDDSPYARSEYDDDYYCAEDYDGYLEQRNPMMLKEISEQDPLKFYEILEAETLKGNTNLFNSRIIISDYIKQNLEKDGRSVEQFFESNDISLWSVVKSERFSRFNFTNVIRYNDSYVKLEYDTYVFPQEGVEETLSDSDIVYLTRKDSGWFINLEPEFIEKGVILPRDSVQQY